MSNPNLYESKNNKRILVSLKNSTAEMPANYRLDLSVEAFRKLEFRLEKARECADRIREISGISRIEVNQLHLVVNCMPFSDADDICRKIRSALINAETEILPDKLST